MSEAKVSLTGSGVRQLWPLIALLASSDALPDEVPARPEDIRPLLIGARVPWDMVLRTETGESTTLRRSMAGGPAVLVFFRGGWCPYCDLQLSELRLIEKDFRQLGFQVIAISADDAAATHARREKNSLQYLLLSDASSALIRAVGIAFRADPAVQRLQPALGVNAATGGQLLTVPAVYIVDEQGRVQFHYVNPDYRMRAPKAVLLAAARAVREPG